MAVFEFISYGWDTCVTEIFSHTWLVHTTVVSNIFRTKTQKLIEKKIGGMWIYFLQVFPVGLKEKLKKPKTVLDE